MPTRLETDQKSDENRKGNRADQGQETDPAGSQANGEPLLLFPVSHHGWGAIVPSGGLVCAAGWWQGEGLQQEP